MRTGSGSNAVWETSPTCRPASAAVNGGVTRCGLFTRELWSESEARDDAAIEGAIIVAILAAGLDRDVGELVAAMDADARDHAPLLRGGAEREGRAAGEGRRHRI